MTIAQSTQIQAYQLNKGGTRARLAILRMIAAASQRPDIPPSLKVADWRAARRYTLKDYEASYATLSQGVNGSQSVWYVHNGEQFRDERWADDCEGGPSHNGWFTMADGECFKDGTGICRGIVARLTHGRFIAGYWWGDNGERVYFPKIYDDEREAAQDADYHAERFADTARADNERFVTMCDAETLAEALKEDAEMAIQARNVSGRHRDAAREAIGNLREAREALADATREYEGA
jgi:hypothetical protein